jgi:serine/threonine protein phosphatase PrpC
MKLSSYAMRSDQGPHLNLNEDSVDVDLINNLYMLIDGFGGAGAGDYAADLVKKTVKQFFTKVGDDSDATMPFYYSHKYLLEGNALINAMRYAHELLNVENKAREMNNRGGASAVAIAFSDNLLTCASVGNCMALQYRKGKLNVLAAADNYELLSGDLYDTKFSTAPLSGFGLFDDLHINLKEARLQAGDQIILLSDGVYARVNLLEIEDIIKKTSLTGQERIEELFSLSNSRGNFDNQSAVILNF